MQSRWMRNWSPMFAALLALSIPLAALPAMAQSTTPAEPVAAQPVTPDDLSPVVSGDIHEYTLPTGQKLYVKVDHNQPIVTVDTWVKTGSVNETADNNGVSHFLEHLLFKGTKDYVPGQIERILESKGAEFNAATSTDYTHFYITAATPYFEEALRLHANMMLYANFPPDELDQERKVVQEEINRAMDNPGRQLYDTLSAQLFPNHGYGLETLGPKENIAKIPRDSILAYYHYWYQPKNFSTVVVGDVDPDAVAKLVAEQFPAPSYAAASPDYQPPAVGLPIPPAGPDVKIITDANAAQAHVMVGFPGPSIATPDDVYALDIGMMILGQGKSARLYQTLKQQKNWVSDVDAGNYTRQYSGVVYVSADLKPENLEHVRPQLVEMLAKIKKDGVTPGELAKAKAQYLSDFVKDDETTAGAAEHIGYEVTIGSLNDYTQELAHIRKIYEADVQMALNKYLDFNHAVWVTMLPSKLPANVTADTEQNTTLAMLNDAKTLQDSPAGAPVMVEAKPQTVPVEAVTLPDGMRLLMKPLKESQTVAIKVFIKGGQGAEPIPGVATLTANMLSQGTIARSAEEISRELESKGMSLQASADEDFLEITGSALKDDLPSLLLVLNDVLTHPAFAEDELAKQKDQLKQSIETSRENPSSVAFENLTMSLYPSHPYGDVGKRVEDHLSLIKRDDLVGYFNQYAQPGNMVVSVVGNFDPETLRHDLGAGFMTTTAGTPTASADTTAPANPSSLKTDAPAAPPPLKENVVVTQNKTKQAATWIARGWLAPAIGDADYASLKVLNSLLGTGMSSRLFTDIREKHGMAYVVGSMYPSHEEDSRFVLYIGTDPKNEQTVQDQFAKEIGTLQGAPVTDGELQQAKDKLIGSFALSHETNMNQAYYLGFFETVGVGYRYDEHYADLVRAVTPADIQRVAQKYFSQPNVTVVVAPKPAPQAAQAATDSSSKADAWFSRMRAQKRRAKK